MEHIQEHFSQYIRANYPDIDDAHADIIKPTGMILHFIEHYAGNRYKAAIVDAAVVLQEQSDIHKGHMDEAGTDLEMMIHSVASKQCEIDRQFVLALMKK